MKIPLGYWPLIGVFSVDLSFPTQTELSYTFRQQLLFTIVLRTVESTVYCPPGNVNAEDGCGNVIEGGWRTDDDNTGMRPILRTGSKR